MSVLKILVPQNNIFKYLELAPARYYRCRAAVAFRRVGGTVSSSLIDDAVAKAEKGDIKKALGELSRCLGCFDWSNL